MINRKRASATLYSLMLSMAPSATGQVLPFFTDTALTVVSRHASLNDQDVANRGGTLIFLTPGFQIVLNPRFLVEATFQIPIVQELNGTQLDFPQQRMRGLEFCLKALCLRACRGRLWAS